ncbi:MAG: hypothetical protein WD037_08870 [Balneolales bacterium]
MWTFLTIIIVTSILAGTYSEYLKKVSKNHRETGSELEILRGDIKKMQKRIENLEIIAAGEPDDFSESYKTGQNGEKNNKSREPEEEVKGIVEKRRNKSW